MRELASPLRFERRHVDVVTTFSNPGLLYNIGNLVAFFGALALFMLLSGSGRGATAEGFVAHFLGNWPAVLTTLASLVFWVSGVQYAKAWAKGFPPEAKSNNAGHALSTLGALTIGVALMGLARTEVSLALAIIATILHAGGKLASWRAPTRDDYFKPMPLYSRVPYVTTLCLDLRSDMLSSGAMNDVVTGLSLPSFLLVATMFWARADWLLLQKVRE
jgi:hypothetical protein